MLYSLEDAGLLVKKKKKNRLLSHISRGAVRPIIMNLKYANSYLRLFTSLKLNGMSHMM